MRRRWNLKSYYARKYGRGEYTKPERMIMECLKRNGIEYGFQIPIKVYDPEENKHYTFTVDFLIKPNIVIEVLGSKVHGTKRAIQKLEWRKKLLEEKGYKVILIWQYELEYDPNWICQNLIQNLKEATDNSQKT